MKAVISSKFVFSLLLSLMAANSYGNDNSATWKFRCNDASQTEIWIHNVSAGNIRALNFYNTRISLVVLGEERAIIRPAALQNVRDNLCEFNVSAKQSAINVIGMAYVPKPQSGQKPTFKVKIGTQNLMSCAELPRER